MSTPFQNRIVGTIIVAAAAIIFLPNFFDGEKQQYQAQFESIPAGEEPVTQIEIKDFPNEDFEDISDQQPIVDEEPSDSQLIAQTEQNSALNKPPIKEAVIEETKQATPKQTTTKKEKPKVVNVTPPSVNKQQAYVIQLGSFSDKNNVDKLLKELKAAGYTTFTKPIRTSAGKNLTKVFIGPEISKASLERKLPKLKKMTGVQGRIAKFQPVD
ncbi:SPOR domain-containing protein [Thalassotalea crassostreae]|uniref:SPOR domain-containing protein n=1 Tax=Thalassotalea crassostreae TaxID=1763536 RepID=UPI00083866A2|nr:SPOR domain-containing protein [Thalassotalea crassostreae]